MISPQNGQSDPPKSHTGISDTYHGLMVGPCSEKAAKEEARDCPLIYHISCSGDVEDAFDLSFERWEELFQNEVYGIAKEHHGRMPFPTPSELNEAEPPPVGTRIIRTEHGWIVSDADGNLLADIEEDVWSGDFEEDDDFSLEEYPPCVFGSLEEAVFSLKLACAYGDALKNRRRLALEELGIEDQIDEERSDE